MLAKTKPNKSYIFKSIKTIDDRRKKISNEKTKLDQEDAELENAKKTLENMLINPTKE